MRVVKLAGYEGRLSEGTENENQLVWMSDKASLGETVETVVTKLLELKNNPYGIPLQRSFEDEAKSNLEAKPNLVDMTLTDILDVYVDSTTQSVVATLSVKGQQTPIGLDEQVSEELVDESLEDSFPASDPPALKST